MMRSSGRRWKGRAGGGPCSIGSRNERLAVRPVVLAGWLTMYVFCAKNGLEIDPQDDDAAYEFVIAVASGKLTEVDEIADVLRGFTAS